MIFGSRELNVSNALRAHLAKSCSLGYGLDRFRDLGAARTSSAADPAMPCTSSTPSDRQPPPGSCTSRRDSSGYARCSNMAPP